jgi:hypothetical protein
MEFSSRDRIDPETPSLATMSQRPLPIRNMEKTAQGCSMRAGRPLAHCTEVFWICTRVRNLQKTLRQPYFPYKIPDIEYPVILPRML